MMGQQATVSVHGDLYVCGYDQSLDKTWKVMQLTRCQLLVIVI